MTLKKYLGDYNMSLNNPQKEILYHAAPIILLPGSIIKAGNFGRIINKVGLEHQLYGREYGLEYIRMKYYPSKPSRLSACFVYLNLDDAIKHQRMQANIIYEVELVESNSCIHKGCFNYLPCQALLSQGLTLEDIYRGYWEGKTIQLNDFSKDSFELVTLSDLKIKRIIYQ